MAAVNNQDGFLGVVQFIHPGAEHRVDKNGWTPWNLTTHKRKYLAINGLAINSSNQCHSSGLFVWAEWEGPSRSIFNWPKKHGEYPAHLVVPQYPGHAKPIDGLQNTDPYIFGDHFKYTLCKQINKNGLPNFLTRLHPGTLILFGSNIKSNFVLDTVMVLGEVKLEHSLADWSSVLSDCSDTYKAMTLEPMYFDKNIKQESRFSYYQGASHNTPFNETYSYSPCIQETDLPIGFERPNVSLSGVINQRLMMGQKRTHMSLSAIQECWFDIQSQIIAHDLCLGVEFNEPEKVLVPTDLWPH
jgi:hypothetical protein